MSRLTPRFRWRQAVMSPTFPRTERAIRGTLLCLVDLMASTGELAVYRDEIVRATGLPARTVDRHLARAVAAGWLRHDQHGGQGRRSLYVAVIPEGNSAPRVARYSTADERDSAPLIRWLSPGNSAPASGALNKESASDSERVAVDDHRGRRTTPDGSREEREHDGTSQAGSNGSGQPTPSKRLSLVPRTEVA